MLCQVYLWCSALHWHMSPKSHEVILCMMQWFLSLGGLIVSFGECGVNGGWRSGGVIDWKLMYDFLTKWMKHNLPHHKSKRRHAAPVGGRGTRRGRSCSPPLRPTHTCSQPLTYRSDRPGRRGEGGGAPPPYIRTGPYWLKCNWPHGNCLLWLHPALQWKILAFSSFLVLHFQNYPKTKKQLWQIRPIPMCSHCGSRGLEGGGSEGVERGRSAAGIICSSEACRRAAPPPS